jgi:hypothetical protein
MPLLNRCRVNSDDYLRHHLTHHSDSACFRWANETIGDRVIVTVPRVKPLSDVEAAAIRRRLAAASPGPWCHREGFIETCTNPSQLLGVTMQRNEEGLPGLPGLANAEFIAHARTDVPRLLDEIERLQAELQRGSLTGDGARSRLAGTD